MPIGSKNKAIAGLGTHHIAIQTRNWEESDKFYSEEMGREKTAQLDSPERRVALYDIGDGSHMELFEPMPDSNLSDSADGHDPVMHFALTTTDVEAAVERVREAGMEITVEPKTVDLDHLNVTLAFFKGPNGEIIEFFQVNN